MSQPTKLKYRINCHHATFNPKTMKYETKQEIYNSLNEASADRCTK
jgi:hypothetical protein